MGGLAVMKDGHISKKNNHLHKRIFIDITEI